MIYTVTLASIWPPVSKLVAQNNELIILVIVGLVGWGIYQAYQNRDRS